MKYKAVSLFSGAMGLDLGLEASGKFEFLACVEVEPAFCETMRRNRDAGRISGNPTIIQADISKLSVEEFLKQAGIAAEDVDVVIGGPPCQSFSTAGRRQSVQDPRGTLLWHYLRFIEGLRPKFFLMENVRGLLSAALRHRPLAERPERGGLPLEHDELPGSVVRLFAQDLQAIDGAPYHMDCFEVNAVNYGAPQLRERALFIGNRFGVKVDFPAPTHGPVAFGGDGTESDLFSQAEALKPWATLGDAIAHRDASSDDVMDFSPRKKQFLAMVPTGSNWRSLPQPVQQESMGKAWHAKGGRSGWWRRLSFDLPSPTLVTMPNHASTALCHPTETRALSVQEYAAIQEFPADWEFSGKTAQQYAQIGNAVPVRLGNVAASVIAMELDSLKQSGWKKAGTHPGEFRLIYVQAHIRTRQWFKAGKTFVWEDGGSNASAAYAKPKTLVRSRALGQ